MRPQGSNMAAKATGKSPNPSIVALQFHLRDGNSRAGYRGLRLSNTAGCRIPMPLLNRGTDDAVHVRSAVWTSGQINSEAQDTCNYLICAAQVEESTFGLWARGTNTA